MSDDEGRQRIIDEVARRGGKFVHLLGPNEYGDCMLFVLCNDCNDYHVTCTALASEQQVGLQFSPEDLRELLGVLRQTLEN